MKTKGTGRMTITIVMLLIGLFIAGLLTNCVLAPQLVNLLADLPMHGSYGIGTGLAFLILVASVVAKAMKSNGEGVGWAIVIVTVCVVAVRVKVVNGQMTEQRTKYESARTAYEEARSNKDAAVAEAKADPDINAKAPYLNRKREARERLAQARAMAVPSVPLKPAVGWDAWIVAVVGPAGLEAATAVLIKLLGGACGGALAFLLAPLGRRDEGREDVVKTIASAARAAGLDTDEVAVRGPVNGALELDVRSLDAEARLGLDLEAGTWRGLLLGDPKRRKGVLWPTLKTEGKRTMFVGSVPARRRAGEVIRTERRIPASARVVPMNRSQRGLGPAGLEAARRFEVVGGT